MLSINDREQSVSTVIGAVILIVLVIILSVGVLFTAQTLIGGQPQDMTAGTTDERTSFYAHEAQLVNQGNTDTVYAVSPLGTEYELESAGDLQKILPLAKGSHPAVDQYQIVGEREGQRQLLKTQHFEEGVEPDVVVHDDGDKDYETIQAAINNIDDDTERDISASDPGVIVVQKGVYKENIEVSDNINLIAEYGTVIQDANPNEDVINVLGENVRVQNFEVDGDPDPDDSNHYARHGINVQGDNAVIQGNTIYRAQSPDVESGGVNIDAKNSVIRYNNIRDSTNSLTLGEDSVGPAICGNQFENGIGGYASPQTQEDIAQLNHWNGGVPANLARTILSEEATDEEDTEYTLPEDTPKSLLQSTSSRIPAEALGDNAGRAGLPFTGTKVAASSEAQASNCEVSINLVNTGDESISIEEIQVTINGRETTIEVVKEVNLGDGENSDTRDKTAQAVCEGCEDGTYDHGDSISISETDWGNIYTYTTEGELEPLPFTEGEAADPEPESFNVEPPGGTPISTGSYTHTSYTGSDSNTAGDKDEDQQNDDGGDEVEDFRILLGSSVDINLADEVILTPVVAGAEGEVEYDWDLGDGTTSSEREVQHFYDDPGTYTVTLTVTDTATGETDTDSTTVTVEEGTKDVEQIRSDEQQRLADLVQEDPDGEGKILYLEEDVTYTTLDTISAQDLTVVGQGNDIVLEGPITVTASDVTLKNVRITEGLIVQNSGFKLYNSKVTSTEGFAVEVDSNGQNFYIGESTIDGWNGMHTNVDGGFTVGTTDISARDEYGFYVDRSIDGVSVRDSTIDSPEVGIHNSLGSNVDVTNTQINAPTEIYSPEPQAPVINDMNAEFSVAQVPIQFSNNVYDPDGFAIDEVTWEMGDGTTYTRQPNNSPLHTYEEPGEYEVTLTVTDQFGTTTTETMTMDVDPLEFSVTAPERASDGDVVTVTPEFNVPDHRVYSVTYNWGDGNSDELPPESRTYQYDSTGTYDIDATLETDTGVTLSTQTTVEVVSSPVADFNIESVPLAGEPTQFNGEYSTAPDGNGLDYKWNMGDGTPPYTTESPKHTFDSVGTYDVSLTVTDSDGFTDTRTVRIPVTNFDVKAGLVDSAGAERPAEFTVDTSISSSQVDYYIVDFGDGSSTKEFSSEPFTHEYSSTGEYDVVIDAYSNGEFSRDTMSVEVTEPPTIGTPEANRDNPSAGTPVEFTIEGPYEYDYKWDFGDGGTATGRINEYTFTEAGTYDVTVTATDSDGVTTQKSITMDVSEFTADFTMSEETPSIADTITFDASASTADPSETTYTWEFGDQTSPKTGETVSHSYDTSGEYTVTLTIEDQYGATDTRQKDILVSEPGTPDYTEGFEDSGLDGWLTNADFNRVTSPTFNGNGAAGIQANNLNENRVAIASPYDDNGKPTKLTFRWTETSSSNSAGLMLENGDGNYEAGFVTQNPQWNVYDANGYDEVYGGSGYGQWVEVEYIFDWDAGTFKYEITDLSSGYTQTGTGTLAHGKGVENIVINNPGSNDIHYWVDDIEFRGDPIANAETPVTTAVTGQEISFDGTQSSGVGASYEWDFDDGSTATGKEVTHAFTEPGTYDVRYDVVDQYGAVDSDFVTITVEERTNAYFEGFESQTTDQWAENTRTVFEATNNKAYDGTHSGRVWDGNAPENTDLASNVVYPGGEHPDKFVYYYSESGSSNSAGIELENTNGDTEVGFHTQNPEWNLVDDRGTTQINGYPEGHDYGQWVKVEFTFEWSTNEYGYKITDLSSGDTREGTGNLAHGQNVEEINIHNPAGDSTYTYFDNIEFVEGVNADMGKVTSDEVTVREGETVSLDAYQSYGSNPTYEWDWGDGTTTTGRTSSHTYASAGEYDVTLTVTDENGNSDSTTKTVTVDGGEYTQSFDNNIDSLRTYEDGSYHSTSEAYQGSGSYGISTGNTRYQLLASDMMYPDGKEIEGFSYYFRETSSSNGIGIRLKNSDGQYEVGTATDNPQWAISDKHGVQHIRNHDNDYDRWVHVQLSFNWEDGTYSYRFEDMASGEVRTGTSDLRYGKDVESYQIEGFSGSWDNSLSSYSWIDEITTSEQVTQAAWSGDQNGDTGETLTFDATASSSSTDSATYEWDFGDGTTGTGETVDHTYTSAGEYEVTLTVTDGTGESDTETKTVNVEQYYEGFESDTDAWNFNNGGFSQPPGTGYDSRFAGDFSINNNNNQVIADTTALSGGERPDRFVMYYAEDSASNGGGIRFVNSNGNYEAGFASDNPQWVVEGASGGEYVAHSAGGYNNWIRVEYNFHWDEGTFGYHIEDLSNGNVREGQKELRQGVDIQDIQIEGYSGHWTSGGDTHMKFDEIQFQNRHEATYDVEKTTIRVDEKLDFDGSQSVGTDATYEWDFDDGTTDSGTRVTHSFSNSGQYDVTLTVREGDGSTETFTRTITVDGGQFSEDFENGLAAWTVHDSRFGIETDRAYAGSQSAGADTGSMNQKVASTVLYPNGKQIENFEYHYWETSSSTGAGIRFINSNGEYEVGTATDNPQWDVSDAFGTREINGGDGYGDWVKVQITFDWEHNEYRYRFENMDTGKVVEGVSELRQGTDVRRIQIESYSGGWESNSNFYMRFDELSEGDKETQAYPHVPESADTGETVSFTEGTSTVATSSATYEWDFGDGTTATGKDVSHSYSSSGDYEVTLTITDSNGNVDSKTRTISIHDYTEDFENGLSDWTVNNGRFQQTTSPVYEGTYSAGLTDGGVNGVIAENTLYENGAQPNKLTYHYYETGDSTGGGIRVVNSNGRYELGTATDNPEWDVSGGGGAGQVNSGADYHHWVRVEINFDWANNEYDYTYTDLNTGKSYSGTKAMRHGEDMSKITIEEYNGGSWGSGNSIYMWFDNIYVDE